MSLWQNIIGDIILFDNFRLLKDNSAKKIMLVLSIISIIIPFAVFFALLYKSRILLLSKPITKILFSTSWLPSTGEFGLLAFIAGTFYVTLTAVIIAVPLSLFTSIYLSEYANKRFQKFSSVVIDLLAGIPSVVYGIWGVLVIVPLIKKYIAPFFGTVTSGYCILSGSIVLAIMIFPIIIQISYEILSSVPRELKDASLALGATKWQTIKKVILRKSLTGIIAAIILGLSRALGETMAVLMVVGNVSKIPKSICDPAYPLTALIANNYGEMLSVPLYDSAIMLAAFILFLIVLIFNIAGRFVLSSIEGDLC